MLVNFLAQPQEQLGVYLHAALNAPTVPTCVTIVSAFASLQAVLRLKQRLYELHAASARIRIVVGVDMGGTSKEVLKELATWPAEVFVFKNRKSGVTFHPKFYIVETAHYAEIFLGSNNLTDGGLYGNYEGAVRVTYQLPAEAIQLDVAKQQLNKFIEPTLPTGRRLDEDYLNLLVARSDIPTDADSRERRKAARSASDGVSDDVFGYEVTPGPPKLPMEVQQVVMAAVRHQLDQLDAQKERARRQRKAVEKQAIASAAGTSIILPELEAKTDPRSFVPVAQIAPVAFYLELTMTKGSSGKIPGEQRIPLEALNAAQDFWGWPDNYVKSINPRKGDAPGGEERVYFNWKPKWRIRSVGEPEKDIVQDIRMYFYQNSSDFRFHSGDLAKWAQAGDMVRITRCENEPYVYECVLAVDGTLQHKAWKALCKPGSGRSRRVFGFS
ncbi:PLD-like domain-containing protein [Nitrosospira multiformis]|uniref:PLD-like domain-containing protein n=2 Tax=Nitrosospira multiformis TaxID=1231 RepID=A0A1H8N5S4_9PROT|nr:PLD-like domain-containing protein [Nitrosospira multiformis]